MLALIWLAVCSSKVHSQAGDRPSPAPCDTAPFDRSIEGRSKGDAITLNWQPVPGAVGYRLWAQWRVPEGAVLSTHEATVMGDSARLPPSPAPGRPLKLSIELEALCAGGRSSPPAGVSQLQFDSAAACPAIAGLELDPAERRARWQGQAGEAVEVVLLSPKDGRRLDQREVRGSTLDWPADLAAPFVIRATRLCVGPQRSQPTYLFVR